jgi:hypothetical protein
MFRMLIYDNLDEQINAKGLFFQKIPRERYTVFINAFTSAMSMSLLQTFFIGHEFIPARAMILNVYLFT